jgi:hypothetical protein
MIEGPLKEGEKLRKDEIISLESKYGVEIHTNTKYYTPTATIARGTVGTHIMGYEVSKRVPGESKREVLATVRTKQDVLDYFQNQN